ncbi:hypothetical protein [Alkalihalobacillus pseudalcaliphilus]|uniref:hypothetical protein n=1 Tax=Alkalihalobacillus pseudalcaliphilus TaxID=79884 RepID=UPI00064DAC19|nr:hypothetical protein [Alkalihalobacillus pseudalcaliphilus]KMK76750.1 hypothetical protein AB990_07490 [Alkalihalobacillus pseudalcaliphilus]
MNEKINFIEKLKEQKVHDFEYLRALSNLIKELKPLQYSTSSILEIWYEYMWKIESQNTIRVSPFSFEGFKGIKGQEHIFECVQEAGVFVSFHLNNYRLIPFYLALFLKDRGLSYKLSLLIDQKTSELEKELEQYEIKKDLIDQVLIAENKNIGFEILKTLEKNHLFLYLDGNTGVGKDFNPIEVNYLSSVVTIRSGIFRLLSIINKPVCCINIVTDQNGNEYLEAQPLIKVTKNNIHDSAKEMYSHFLNILRKNPENWRFWYRHHLQVSDWKQVDVHSDVLVDYYDKQNLFGLSLEDGNFYKVGEM